MNNTIQILRDELHYLLKYRKDASIRKLIHSDIWLIKILTRKNA